MYMVFEFSVYFCEIPRAINTEMKEKKKKQQKNKENKRFLTFFIL